MQIAARPDFGWDASIFINAIGFEKNALYAAFTRAYINGPNNKLVRECYPP
jgi:hypothetical protein